jgi:hypothetical protein
VNDGHGKGHRRAALLLIAHCDSERTVNDDAGISSQAVVSSASKARAARSSLPRQAGTLA